MSVDMSDYIDVAERIAMFREAYPQGSLQTLLHENGLPYVLDVVSAGDTERIFLVVTAMAYRTPDDERPGVACAWEPFPGATPYTRNSELMNAETSAWGRAIVATLAADTKRGIATAQEVRNRAEERHEEPKPKTTRSKAPESFACSEAQRKKIYALSRKLGLDADAMHARISSMFDVESSKELTKDQASKLIDAMQTEYDAAPADPADLGEEVAQ